ncbi:MAG: diguanylate cyclase [Thermoanaerobaculia bacterium]
MSTEAARKRHRLLLVDDQPGNVQLLAEVLAEGFELHGATSGPRALELAARERIDLVLLDVMMPGMDGFEVCRRLKADERTRGIPVIFVTSLGEVQDETAGFEAGGVDYITKPISPPVVRARVRTHIALKEARDRLEELALVDGLTGVANRRRFEECLESEWRRAQRNRHWLSLALLDIDHFKGFNDRYGHAQGDECLRAVAQALATVCRRPSDLFARYGGEEFALVLPETAAEGAQAALLLGIGRVAELAIAHDSSSCDAKVSVSLGAVSLIPAEGDDPKACLERVDRLLYDAKRDGRRHGLHQDLVTGIRVRIPASLPAGKEEPERS